MLDPNMISALKQNYKLFCDRIAVIDSRFIVDQTNFDTIRKWCHSEGVTDVMLAEPNGDKIFSAAYTELRAANRLELTPAPPDPHEQAEARRRRLHAKDREAGSLAGNRKDPDEKGATVKFIEQAQKNRDALVERAKQETKDAAAQAAQQKAWETRPGDFCDFRQDYSEQELRALPSPVLQYYIAKRRDYLRGGGQ